MSEKPYHHGNLKQEFIEKGLTYIDRYGVESLSMRKLAESIGVSSAAPYAHFKNKDAFLAAIQDYITESLTAALRDALSSCKDPQKVMLELGRCYVLFFYENPLYFQFLFTRKDIDFTSYAPYQLFRPVAAEFLARIHKEPLSAEILYQKIIAMWALVHGLAQFALIGGVLGKDNLEQEISKILYAVEV